MDFWCKIKYIYKIYKKHSQINLTVLCVLRKVKGTPRRGARIWPAQASASLLQPLSCQVTFTLGFLLCNARSNLLLPLKCGFVVRRRDYFLGHFWPFLPFSGNYTRATVAGFLESQSRRIAHHPCQVVLSIVTEHTTFVKFFAYFFLTSHKRQTHLS